MRADRGLIRFVHSAIPVKFWEASPPSVSEARPERCRACNTPARRRDGTLAIQGHGLRERCQRGATAEGEAPRDRVLSCRRYRCECGAILVVGPRGILRRFLFAAGATGLALARWAGGAHAADVRREVSAQRTLGATAAAGWASLARWVSSSDRMWRGFPGARGSTRRERAGEIAGFLAAHARSPTGDRVREAAAGAPWAA